MEEAVLVTWEVLSKRYLLLLFPGSGQHMVLPSAVHQPAPYCEICSVTIVQN